MDAAAVEARLKAFFEDDPRGAVAVYLFGSVARGEAGPGSDVDVGILFGTDPPATLDAPQFAIEAALERVLRHPVQIVALNRASADLVREIQGSLQLGAPRVESSLVKLEPGWPRPLAPL